jgi:hypothetical protein
MNINAGTNSYNIKLTKLKEEKRPTFATIFDKLDARSKKLNNKNPLNAVMTQEQMFRYYLEEIEPMIQGSSDSNQLDTLDEILGNKDFKDMKLSEFAKLLMGNINDDKGVKYETLSASVSSNGAMSIAPVATPPTPLPTPPPTPPTPPPIITTPVIPGPSSSIAGSVAPPIAVSGIMPTPPPTIPVAVSGPAGSVVASSGLSVSIPAALSTVASTFSPSAVFASLTGTPSATGSKLSPSAISVPPSAVASGATTLIAPTPTPSTTGILSPTAGGPVGAATGPSIDTGGYTDRDRISAFSRAITEGLNPPRIPISKTKTISKDEDMIKYAIELSKYNDGLKDKKFSIKPTTAIGKMITTYERLAKRGASENDIIKEIKSGK